MLLILLVNLAARLSMFCTYGLKIGDRRPLHNAIHLNVRNKVAVHMLTHFVYRARNSRFTIVLLKARVLLEHEPVVDNGCNFLLLTATVCFLISTRGQTTSTFGHWLEDWLRLAALKQNC